MGSVTPELLERLLDEHAAALELYAGQWTDRPDDCVQEAMIRLARQAALPERLLPWLYRVVRNRAISMARSAGRRRRHEQQAAQRRRPWFVSSPANQLDAQTVTDALEAISGEHREVIVARIWGGLSFAEIASVAGISQSAAHRRYEAGLKALRAKVGLTWLTETQSSTSYPTT